MGYIREERAARILEDTLLEWLEDGIIPTTGELQEGYDRAVKAHGDLTRSGLRQVPLPERWSESSSSQHNVVIDKMSEDLEVLLRSLVSITDLGTTQLGEWDSRSKSLQARISKLKERIESLLLVKSDTAGFISFVEDGFLSLENVSSDTTANVDTRTGEVTLGIDRSDGSGEFQGTQIDLDSAQVSWSIIEDNNVRFSALPAGSNLRNIITSKKRRWGLEIESIRPDKFRTASKGGKPVMGELKIKLPEKQDISKVALLTSDATAANSSVIALQYSADGYTWENVPSESSVQSGVGNFVWRFSVIEAQWIKFVISKASPDSSNTTGFIYDFGFESVKVYKEVFNSTADGVVLISESLTPELGGADVSFSRASLEVCEEVPDKTSLRYFLRAYNGSTFTEWVQVSPLSRTQDNSLAVVDFTAPSSSISEDLTTVFDSTLDVEALNILRVDGSGDLSYRFTGPNDTLANFYISQNDNLLTDLVLLRNMGYSDAKFPTLTTDLKVGEIECGWGLDGDSSYYCEFLVKRPGGMTIDFGHTTASIDGRSRSGVVDNISPGWHSFRTDRANWAPLSSSSVPTSSSELDEIDPLYPYNHKYLIEGYTYPTSWTGESVYLGSDAYGQYRANRIGRHLFANTELDMSVYALDVLSGPKTIVLLKFDSSRSNHENEKVRLFYTRRFENFESVQFKTILKTDDVERTPVLSYYRVRVK